MNNSRPNPTRARGLKSLYECFARIGECKFSALILDFFAERNYKLYTRRCDDLRGRCINRYVSGKLGDFRKYSVNFTDRDR